MLTIDRYILRLFTKVALISFASLTGLYIMIDTAGNFEEFVSYSGRLGGFFRVIGDYYGPRVFTFFDRISGLLPLIAAMFAVTWLQRTNELTALMAGGVSKLRVLAPLIIAAVVVSLLGVANRELLIPSVREKLTRNAQDWLGETPRPLTPRYDITFSSLADPWKRRRHGETYEDFRMMADDGDDIVFIGSKVRCRSHARAAGIPTRAEAMRDRRARSAFGAVLRCR